MSAELRRNRRVKRSLSSKLTTAFKLLRACKMDHATLTATQDQQFLWFPELPDDVQRQVLSFVATGPLERISSEERRSKEEPTLTKVFPLVCRKFRSFCMEQALWEPVLTRAIKSDRSWRKAANRVLDENVSLPALRKTYRGQATSHLLYQMVLQQGLRFTGPVFISHMQQKPRSLYEISLKEPRYRAMMAELVHERGEKVEPIMFLHVHDGKLASISDCSTVGASLVQIVQFSSTRPGGGENAVASPALVIVQVVATVRLERYWVRPQSKGLYYAQAIRTQEQHTQRPVTLPLTLPML
jgi:hypothetical protein